MNISDFEKVNIILIYCDKFINSKILKTSRAPAVSYHFVEIPFVENLTWVRVRVSR